MSEREGYLELQMKCVLDVLLDVGAILAELRRYNEAEDGFEELRDTLLTLAVDLKQLYSQLLLLNAYAEKSVSGPEQ